MAIQKDREVDGGFTANHWYLNHVTLYRNDMTAHGGFQLFKSRADRLAGKQPVGSVNAKVDITGGSMTMAQLVNALEAAARATGGSLDGGSSSAD